MEPQVPMIQVNTKKTTNWKWLLIPLIVVVVATITGFTTWYFMDQQMKSNKSANVVVVDNLQKQIDELKKANTTQSSTPTPPTAASLTTQARDQIFQEVATQFNLKRDNVQTFKIFGLYKVSYGLKTPTGVIFAYKQSGQWQKITPESGTVGCSVYANVPEQFKPICAIEVNGKSGSDMAYTASDGGSVNYSQTKAIKYIGS